MIIDCGATTCKVHVLTSEGYVNTTHLKGFSPIVHDFESLPIPEAPFPITSFYFFGTGFEEIFWARAQKIYQQYFPDASFYFGTDLEAAALATCKDASGYVHVIGTGSASARWDGEKVIREVPNLGYLFEDYASGYDIAREIIRWWKAGDLNRTEISRLSDIITLEKLIQKVYQSKSSKNTLANYSIFLNHLENENRNAIINTRLEQFYNKNIDKFTLDLPHHFVGSMAFLMKDFIIEKGVNRAIKIGEIVKETDTLLIEYFKNKITNHNV